MLPELAREVFRDTYGAPTRAQELAWPVIAAGAHALVVAPTGSGKTLAAFYAFLGRMVEEPPTVRGVELVYVSPLKALASDIERNLRGPLAALERAGVAAGRALAPVPVMVRTGDTPGRERAAMLRRPPRILVTTPESLYLLLTSTRGRAILKTTRAVIIDEVHALVPTKRGVHLGLSLERLERLVGGAVQRVGLSATVAPQGEAARWLGGRDAAGNPRAVTILDAAQRKEMDLAILAPADPAVVGPRGIWPPLIAEVARIIAAHRSTLVFCNNRRQAERVTAMLNEQAGGHPLACSHHGSVSKERRREVEEQLKAGALRAVVATGSLELGIDVGAVDCVIQLQSPRSVSRALQRIGRSGHVVGGTPKGRILPTHRGDFLEAAAVTRLTVARAVEETFAPGACLDILAQQIVAETAAAGESVAGRQLYEIFRRAYSFRSLTWDDFIAVVEMLSGRAKVPALREMRPRVDWDPRRGLLAALPGSRLHATARAGAIPDRGLFRVELEGTRERLGELDEEFVFESRVGDVFVLGATSWRIARIARDRVIVRAAGPGEPARMPFWRGEGLGRSYDVGRGVGALVRELAELLAKDGAPAALEHARSACLLDPTAARTVVEYVERQRQATGALPDDRTVVVELFADDLGDARVALLSPFGGRLNAAWAILIVAEARRRLGLDVPHVATDDGITFRAPSGAIAEQLLGMARWIRSEDVGPMLDAEIDGTPLYAGLFRDAAQRSTILPASRGGRAPLWLARLRAADLAQLLHAHPEFPLAREARREALEDSLDARGLARLLGALERGDAQVVLSRRTLPSPFAAQLELAFTTAFLYEGDAPRAERRARALAAGPEAAALLLPPEELESLLDPEAVAQVDARRQHLAPGTAARTAEELADVLRRLGDLTDDELTARFDGDAAATIERLSRDGRMTRFPRAGRTPWILAEDVELWRALDDPDDGGRAARAELLRRYAAAHGPFVASAPARRYGLEPGELDGLLAALVRDGLLARGRFLRGSSDDLWCDRRNLAEAHRRTLAGLRDRAAPVKMPQLAAYLLHRHRSGDVSGAVHLLAGVPVPQETFERDLLWRRVQPYHPPLLDAACAAGDVSWLLDGNKLVAAPRTELALFAPPATGEELTDDEQAVLAVLESKGAMFGPELVTAVGRRPSAVYTGVWALIRRGLATNDAYEALRRAVGNDFDPEKAGLEHSAGVSVRTLVSRARRSPWVGRFSRLVPDGASPPERALREAAIMLRRYGVVGKPMADAEGRGAPWPALEEALRGLELRGEVVRGYFVDGLGAYQVALSEAIDDLRGLRADPTPILVNACDPCCPYGSLAPVSEGRVARLPSNYLVLRAGEPLLLVEGFGKRITPLMEAGPDELVAALAALRGLLAVPAHLRGVRAVTVHRFADHEAAESQDLFVRAGFSRDGDRMVLSPT